MRAAARAVTVIALAGHLVAALSGAALAHGRGSDATNFLSRVTEAPGAEGLRWRVLGGDEQLELRNDGPHEVVVLGHEGEPYLRVGPRGAFENRRSPTVALHRERYRTSLPAGDGPAQGLDAGAAPEWVRVSEAPRWAWHDHRIHWMSPQPPAVEGETVLIPRWEVPVLIDGEPAVVAGELRWIPAPPWWPWVLAGLALTVPALLGLRAPRPDAVQGEPRRWPRAVRPAVAVVLGVVALNVVHLPNDLTGPVALEARLFTAAQTALYLALGAGGAWRARGGDYAGVTALAIGTGALFLGQGLLFLPLLGASQPGVAGPEWLVRLAVGASLAVVVPVGVVVARVGGTVQPPEGQATAESPGT